MSVWNEVLNRLAQKLSTPSFDTWLKDTRLLPYEENTDTLIIETKNEFGRDWLEGRYANSISETLLDITGKQYKLKFIYNEHMQENDYIDKRMVNMSDQLLQQILNELKEIKAEQQSMKVQLNENTEIVKAFRDRQEETDAKLENLTIDVHKVHGEVTMVKELTHEIKNDIEFTYQKTSKNELEIFKLRKASVESN